MKKWISFIFISLFACQLMASAVSFKASLSHKVVEVGQRFKVTFTVNSGGGNFTPPSFSNFRMLSGPNQSSSMQYINGQMSRSFSISYILQATKKGKFTIDPAIIVVDGKEIKTEALDIEVVDANSNSSNAQNQRQNQRKNSGNELSDYVYIKAFVDKRTAYVGEKLTATFKLYSKLNLSTINLEDLPELNGFWSHDIRSVYDQIQLSTEYIDGEVYQVANLKQTLLYPQRAGELLIDPLEMKAIVQVRSRRSRSVFESMFGSYENREVILASKPIKVNIKALPTYRGNGEYAGAVGKFNAKLSSNKTDLKANEAIDLKIEISGEGNLPLIAAPQLNFPPDLEVYDPETENKYKNSLGGSAGKKIFNYLIIPRHSGNFIIDPYVFTYFDPSSGKYKTIQTDSIVIRVARGAEEENVVYNPADRKEEVELLEEDIRYIHLNHLVLLNPEDQFYGSASFYLIIAGLLLLLIGLYFISRKYKDQQADTVGLRRGKAKKIAVKRMSKAKQFLDRSELSNFYEEISIALYGYFADKFNMSTAELSKEELISRLRNRQANEDLVQLIDESIEQAEMARFGASSAVDPNTLYESAKRIIEETESIG